MKRVFYLNLVLLLILALSLVACGGGSTSSGSSGGGGSSSQAAAPATGDAAAGKETFTTTCSACHGPEGKGVPGLGKDMTASEFIAGKSDAELVDFIKIGRDPSDPLNTTGVAMPPKGGNPALNDNDLLNVVTFIRTLQQ
jgi:disulfide bond formation protein DsbB